MDVRLAFVRLGQDRAANVVLHSGSAAEEAVLTHFVEPLNMSDVTWSRDGEWIAFVSAHDYVYSRNNERNVFVMRPDGTELRMVTGDYVDPEEAPGPYTTLRGQVVNGQGDCLVNAQGVASPVLAGPDGVFALPGVPLSATWARAICQTEDVPLQGDVDLEIEGDTLVPVGIPVEPHGGGWTQVSLSSDGTLLAGTRYEWSLDDEGAKTYVMAGPIANLQGQVIAEAQLPEDTTLMGLDWSPLDDTLAGGLTGEKGTWIWRWDALGDSLGAIVEIPNTDQALLSAVNPAWSPDGTQIAFGLRQWHLWEEDQSRTELAVYRLEEGEEPRVVGPAEWGQHVDSPSWSADGHTVYYELSDRAEGDETWSKANGHIWMVPVTADQPVPTPWPSDEERYLPGADPSS